jgi:2-polyprenyl-3-methyl-5-hydroxy-6-metoxy-1,4-benzoquinol methylase
MEIIQLKMKSIRTQNLIDKEINKLSDRHNEVEIISNVNAVSFADEWYEYTSETHFWFQWRLKAMLRQIKDLDLPTNKGIKVLEVGSGTGLLRRQVELATSWVVDGADLNLRALLQAKQGRGRNILYNVYDESELLVESYEIVILFDVLEHIQETHSFLKSVLKHIKPGGLLLLNVPALQFFYSSFDEVMGHFRRYNKRTLIDEFKDLNFEILDIRYWGLSLLFLLGLRKFLMMALKLQKADTVKLGFNFPDPFASFFQRSLHIIMHLETALFTSTPIGTSILMAGRKLKRKCAL